MLFTRGRLTADHRGRFTGGALALAILLTSFGCSKGGSTSNKEDDGAAEPDEASVRQSWEQFMARAKSPQRIAEVKEAWAKANPKGSLQIIPGKDEVKKSERLKRGGYVGTASLEASYSTAPNAGWREEYEVHFGHKRGRWEFIYGTVKTLSAPGPGGESIARTGPEAPFQDLTSRSFLEKLFQN
jgi:hypothetical protein